MSVSSKNKGTYYEVQFSKEIKELVLKMRKYNLKQEWEKFNKLSSAYQESIFNDQVCEAGSTKSIAAFEKDESTFRLVFSQKNSQGYHHWFQNIMYYVTSMNPSIDFENQTNSNSIGVPYTESLVNDYGIELAKEFFKWYQDEHKALEIRVKEYNL